MVSKKKAKSTGSLGDKSTPPEGTASVSVKELRFMFYERLFGYMAAFRAAGYRYSYQPQYLAYRRGDESVLAFNLDEILIKTVTVELDPADPKRKKMHKISTFDNPKSVGWVKKAIQVKDKKDPLVKANNGSPIDKVVHVFEIDPPLVKETDPPKAVTLHAPNGVPFTFYYRDNIVPVHTKKNSTEEIASINCCTSTLAAFYREWQRLQHAGFENDTPDAKLNRLPHRFHDYFMVNEKLPEFEAAGAKACDLPSVALIVQDGGKSCITDLRDMRRGDIAQIFWNGYKDEVWEERTIKTNKKGRESIVWKRVSSEPVVAPEEKRKVRDLNLDGHSVFIHDVLQRNGKLYFHSLSAQGNDLSAGGTRGVGLAGSGRDAYAVDQAGLQAELFEAATCYRYEKDSRGKRNLNIVPELFVGRLRRPFPCWPVTLPGAKANLLPLPTAYGSVATNLKKDDDVDFVPANIYTTNCEREVDSGYYPIGLSRVWHGGVHFKLSPGTPVRAIADGVIVAVRCAGKSEDSGLSRNFVLIRHQVEYGGSTQVFYSLAMHLRSEGAGQRPIDARWLWQFDRKARIGRKFIAHPDGEALTVGGVVCLAYPVGAGEIVGHSDGDFMHFEVFTAQDVVDSSYPGKEFVSDDNGDALYDSRKLLDLLESKCDLGQHLKALAPSPGAARSGVVLQEEIVAFFRLGSEKAREALRGLVTKHVSEWSTAARWPDLKDTGAWGYYDIATAKDLQDAQERNAWLTADVARWCKLPADGVLVHYHPVAFIDWLADRAVTGACMPLVQRVSEILDGGPAPVVATPADNAADDADADAAADESPSGGVRWELDPSAGIPTLALGTLGTSDSFRAQRRETGPWTQIGAVRRSPKGNSEFVKVSNKKGGLWICVHSSGRSYARRVA
jgi:murein DD-endopeptidase MepM/ murein hydrolase activator NlpD